MKPAIAYLVNQYPKVSHSFIRREIQSVEKLGIHVSRFSIRSCADELVDDADKSELGKTRIVLESGLKTFLISFLFVILSRPIRFFSALQLALNVGQKSERGVIYHLVYLVEACVLLRWFLEDNVQHVHTHFGTNSTTVAMFCRELGGPEYSFTVHGPEEFDKATTLGLHEKIQKSKFVVAISSFGKSQLYRWCDYTDWSKIHVVRCGVDEDFCVASQAVLNESQFVCVARLSEQKGHFILVEAVRELVSEGIQCRIILAGDGPLRTELESLIKRYELENNFEITGWISSAEVRKFIQESKVLVLPSFAEGLPVVIMEALALERPVISTYVAGIPELVEPGVCGWLVPSGSVHALREAMREALVCSTDRLEEMGKCGSKRVQTNHDVFKEASKLVNLFSLNGQDQRASFPRRSVELHREKINT